MRPPDCVGALVINGEGRVYVHRRAATRRILPGVWDIVGGHTEPGEAEAEALAREIEEETGWRLRRIIAGVADWEWEHDGKVRREVDYLVEVDGDLGSPKLEEGKHDACAWVGPDNLDLMREGRTEAESPLYGVVARALRFHGAAGTEAYLADKRPEGAALFRQFAEMAMARADDVIPSVSRTVVYYKRRRVFAGAFVRGKRLEPVIDLLREVQHPCLRAAFPTTKKVISHRLTMTHPDQIDESIRELLREAYETVGPGTR